jgi:hypothetical protein
MIKLVNVCRPSDARTESLSSATRTPSTSSGKGNDLLVQNWACLATAPATGRKTITRHCQTVVQNTTSAARVTCRTDVTHFDTADGVHPRLCLKKVVRENQTYTLQRRGVEPVAWLCANKQKSRRTRLKECEIWRKKLEWGSVAISGIRGFTNRWH